MSRIGDASRPMRFKLNKDGLGEGYEQSQVPKLDPNEIVTDAIGQHFRRSQVTPRHQLALNLAIYIVTQDMIKYHPDPIRGMPVMGPWLEGELLEDDEHPHYHAYIDTLLCKEESNWGHAYRNPLRMPDDSFGSFIPPAVLFPLATHMSVQKAQVGLFTQATRRNISVTTRRWDAGHLLVMKKENWRSLEPEALVKRREANSRIKDYVEQMHELRLLVKKEKEFIRSLKG